MGEAANPGTMDRLAAELNFNSGKADYEPVTDSSLTYGDLRTLRAMAATLSVSEHKLADMLRESEPHRYPDDGDTEMVISVEDARRIGWALIGHHPDRDAIVARFLASSEAPPLGSSERQRAEDGQLRDRENRLQPPAEKEGR